MPSSAVAKRINDFVKLHGIALDAPALVAVSGGADSVGLLHGLLDCGFTQLIVCHLNHGLRGEESDADEQFVKALCASHCLAFSSQRVDVGAMQGSMETAARDARYDFFMELAARLDCNIVFLGHHADDQAETLLYNLCRGGLGLKGIKPHSTRVDGELSLSLYRPLLALRKNQIEAYLEQKNQKFCEDSSNKQAVAVRNRIRNEALPLLNEILARDVTPLINKAAELSERRSDYTDSTIDLKGFLDPQGRLFLPKLQQSHRFVQDTVLKDYLTQNGVAQVSSDLLERASRLLHDSEVSKLNLAEGKFLRRKEKRLFISD